MDFLYASGKRVEGQKSFNKSDKGSYGGDPKKNRVESFAVPWSRKVYVVNIQYSPYQQKSGNINTYTFEYKKKAQNFMRSEAKKLYYTMLEEECLNYDSDCGYSRENTPPTLLGHRGPYWYECKDCIFFGDDYTKGECFERAWGVARLYETIVDRHEQ